MSRHSAARARARTHHAWHRRQFARYAVMHAAILECWPAAEENLPAAEYGDWRSAAYEEAEDICEEAADASAATADSCE